MKVTVYGDGKVNGLQRQNPRDEGTSKIRTAAVFAGEEQGGRAGGLLLVMNLRLFSLTYETCTRSSSLQWNVFVVG